MSTTIEQALLLFERLMVDVSKFRIFERSWDEDLEGTGYHVGIPDGRSVHVMILDSDADDLATGFTTASFVVKHLGSDDRG